MTKFNPRMLTIARESRGMTQKRLAELSRVAQGTVSKAEGGLLEPSPEHLESWAQALNYRASVFSSSAEDALPVTFFRKQQALPAMAARLIRAAVALRRIRVERLANSVELPENRVPSVTLGEGSLRSVAHVARELRVSWKVPRGPIENLTELLEDNGVVVIPVDFGSDQIVGMSIYERRSGQPPMMFVSKTAPGDRLRFTCAHELCHIVLHHHCPLPPVDCEQEADTFASEFLMPDADIKGQFSPKLSLADLAQLKTHWRVSMSSLLMKAQSLGRISESHATRLWRQMSMMGYRKQEPVQVPREQPGLMAELVRVHLEDLQYTNEQLSSALHMNVEEFLVEYGRESKGLRLIRAPNR
jgi:Zn-dependent peptidase ImmA (M78 family)/transcriptional regulator with XRE-family HTH domain